MVPLYPEGSGKQNTGGYATNASRKGRIYFWCGLAAILVLFSSYYVFFLYGLSMEMPIKGRHVVKLLFTLLVYAVGAMCIPKFSVSWLKWIWRWAYLGILALLLLLGAYDWGIARTPVALRELADTLHEFLVSPILYVAIRLLSERAYRTGV